MSKKTKLLTVVAEQFQAQVTLHGERLLYSFSNDLSPNGLCAWPSGDAYRVSENCQSINGLYRQQALNSVLARKVMHHRPDQIVVWGLNGATVDLPRVAALLGLPCYVVLNSALTEPLESMAAVWLKDSFSKATAVSALDAKSVEGWGSYALQISSTFDLAEIAGAEDIVQPASQGFDYSLYELCSRDHSLIVRMQEHDVEHFRGCHAVLDIGCGAGLFLQLLEEQGISSRGVERNPVIADYANGAGLNVIEADSLEYLRESKSKHDGIYCSHFVEHLPIEVLQEMLKLMADCLEPGGVLVLTFPDPESIRSQLLGFWRDPEHVRFYHPDLIRVMTEGEGLLCEWSSYEGQPHEVYPFQLEPEAIERAELTKQDYAKPSVLQRILRRLGVASTADLKQLDTLKQQLEYQQNYIDQLEERTRQLWNVNKTWAWNDNVTLRFRKP